MPNGERVTATVRDNAFLWSGTSEAPAAVYWTNAEGAHAVELPTLSPEALEAMKTK
jgi:hypothetical protein